nr:protein early flowering 4-like [Tanacetum cinerariifolium]
MESPKTSGEKRTAKRRLTGNDDSENEAWMTLSKSLKEAQSALDKNRLLIQQVNENHQSKISENMVKNVALIKEINGNISKVSDVYSSLSVNFASFVRDRRVKKKGEKVDDDDDED